MTDGRRAAGRAPRAELEAGLCWQAAVHAERVPRQEEHRSDRKERSKNQGRNTRAAPRGAFSSRLEGAAFYLSDNGKRHRLFV